MKARDLGSHPLGKNPGDVWQLSTSNFRGGHHATFPTSLVERPIRVSCPERVCLACGEPWTRTRVRSLGHLAVAGELVARCKCSAGYRAGIVLDPFMGSGTVAVVAEELGRHWLGIEVNPDFVAMAKVRIRASRIGRDDAARAA